MNPQERKKVNGVLRVMSKQWGIPVWKTEQIIQEKIDKTWKIAMLEPDRKVLLDKYFPDGKPTPQEYILRLGHAHETEEDVPFLLID